MSSKLLSRLGQLHIVTGSVSADLDTLTCNDGSATITNNGAGDCTVTFGDVFLSTPIVVTAPVGTGAATLGAPYAAVAASATNSVQFSIGLTGDTDTVPSVVDGAFGFVAIGLRDN